MKKCVILTGAGAASLWKVNGDDPISTNSITKALCDKDDFFSNLSSYLSSKFTNGNQVNFETILHAIEVLFQYYRGKMLPLDFIPSAIFNLEESSRFLGIDEQNPNVFLKKMYDNAIDVIREEIFKYDNAIKENHFPEINKKVNDFLELFFQNKVIIRGYTTNYDQMFIDCCHDKSVFNDGTIFDETNIHNRSYFHKPDIHSGKGNCFFNLHGSINWNSQSRPYAEGGPFLFKEEVFSPLSNFDIDEQNPKESILLSPIITGYNKVQRIHFEPFLAFSNSFYRDCSDADCFIFIGFSFADPYLTNVILNSEIKTKKVLIIDPNPEGSQLIRYLDLDKPDNINGLLKYHPKIWLFQKSFEDFLCVAEDILNDFFK